MINTRKGQEVADLDESKSDEKTLIIEKEINLSLLNDKLNYIIASMQKN